MSDNKSVSGVILASGFSSRFRGDKLSAKLDEKPIVAYAVENALNSELAEVIVVIDPDNKAVRKLMPDKVKIAENRHREEGISSAVKAGLKSVDENSTAALFLVGDQPFVSPALINRIVKAYLEEDCQIVSCSHKGVWKNPMLFDRSFFEQLLSIAGDVGAKQVALLNPDRVCTVEVKDPFPLFDIDTFEDLEKARRLKTMVD
ncbi:MAG TPA: nucleotidyltransferase family protein [Thermoplasmataceae archaeon]|nr:nucleotidyltransferase family protein [Thermoplasmataceae archaeon]